MLGCDYAAVLQDAHFQEFLRREAWRRGDLYGSGLLFTDSADAFSRGVMSHAAFEAEVALAKATLSSMPGTHWREYLDAWKAPDA